MTNPIQKNIAKIWTLVLLVVGLQACNASGPKPINYGKDQCVYCKMTISDARFGTQLLTKKGRTYNFDDLSCMVAFAAEGTVSKQDIENLYVPDYSQDKKLYPANEMFFLKSESLKSPMRGDIAAFKNEADLKRVQKELGGKQLAWKEIWK
ncbi:MULTISPECIES: nitrous oxide reductase accessory protein NosL [Sphingobacterium]|uniref:nitrous oxide reductase accessory protein NosL n=1 Tax=Sphingobacterium TaxID=28453 RepID=UPI0013DD12A5|nr:MULTISPECIES: nitrous oxide reductase accessory protein NosL [unclassified Sphingobacterium]